MNVQAKPMMAGFDGERFPLRRLVAADRDALARHFCRLPADARWARFQRSMNDAAIHVHCAHLDFAGSETGMALRAGGGAITGTAIAYPLVRAGHVEIAVSLEPPEAGTAERLEAMLGALAGALGREQAVFLLIPCEMELRRILREHGAVFDVAEEEARLPVTALLRRPLSAWMGPD